VSGATSEPRPAEVARVLAGLQSRTDDGGFLRRQTVVLDCLVDPLGRMPETDLADGLVDVLGVSRFADPRRLLLGDATGFEHLVESVKETVSVVIHRRRIYGDILSLSNQLSELGTERILRAVPKLWNDTIEAHRRAVRDATLDTTAALVAEHGLAAVTMSQIAEETGIGRATLYKYFPDVDAILAAWHDRQVTDHLHRLAEARQQGGDARERLSAVLEAYALIHYDLRVAHGTEIAALLHRRDHVVRAQQHLSDFVRDLLSEAAQFGDVRDDISPEELATYCLHSLTAANALRTKAAVRRLVEVTLAGLRPPP
jgi:AcrR family transcriptional regulator